MNGNGPMVSVLMPTYKQEVFIGRALHSLLTQRFEDWELVIVDDGTPDNTYSVIHPYLTDPRIRYTQNARNEGLGAALNIATRYARGRYIAYLPSDDVYHADHLEALVAELERKPDVYLAYAGVQTGYSGTYEDPDWRCSATLRGDDIVGHELEALTNAPAPKWQDTLKSGNIIALVQVMHRRSLETECQWTPRSTEVSDRLEANHWRALLERGAKFSYVGRVTCQWVQHPEQRHRIIGGRPNRFGRMSGGLAVYRSHYQIRSGEYLNWQPALGFSVDEHSRCCAAVRRYAPYSSANVAHKSNLRILVVGDLGFNPERLLLFEHAGHQLAGLWLQEPSVWLTTGPFPWGHIVNIDSQGGWLRHVRDFSPDVIFAGVTWPSIPLISRVIEADLAVPLIFHFKEGPGHALRHDLWPALFRLMTRSDGQIFINDESREWFRLATGGAAGRPEGNHLILDADLAVQAWFSEEYSPKLSHIDGEMHTVCPGGWEGTYSWADLAEVGIHVHLYGDVFHNLGGGTVTAGDLGMGYVHLHPTVSPPEWVAELSKYDAGWTHVFTSANRGDMRAATWNDLNYPGRLPTLAAAGLPWIMWNNRANESVTALENLASRYDVGIPICSLKDLADRLSDRARLRQLTANMREHRHDFTVDAHFDRLIAFIRATIAHCQERGVRRQHLS